MCIFLALNGVVVSLTNSDKVLVLPSIIPPAELPDTVADYFTDEIAKTRTIFDMSDTFARSALEDFLRI